MGGNLHLIIHQHQYKTYRHRIEDRIEDRIEGKDTEDRIEDRSDVMGKRE